MSDLSAIENAIESHVFVSEGTTYKGEPYRYENYGWGEWDGKGVVQVEGVGAVKLVEQAGGEGEGDSAHLVFEVTDGDGVVKLYKMDGSYASYDGFYWDGPFTEAELVTKTIQVYESI